MKKIGVLLPQSKTYQTIGREFMNGLRLLPGEDYSFIVEGIGLGNNSQVICDRIDKLSLQENVSAVIGFVGDHDLKVLHEKVNNLQLPTLFVRLGAFPDIKTENNRYAINLSYGLCDAISLLGDWFVNNGYGKVAVTGSFNDIGYGFTEALEKPLYEAGGQFAGHHIPPLHPRENEAQLAEEFYTSTEFDIACQFYNGAFAEENIEYLTSFQDKIKEALMFGPFALNKDQLQRIGDLVNEIFMFASWIPVELRGEASEFDQDYYKKYGDYPTVNALLGFESGLLLDLTLNQPVDIQEGETISIETPRGTCVLNEDLKIQTPQRIWKAEKNNGSMIMKEIKTSGTDKNITVPFEGQENGWHNAYLCY